MNRLIVGGIPTVSATRAELAQCMVSDWRQTACGKLPLPRIVTSSNGSVIYAFNKNSDFRALMLQADIIDADGMALVIASRVLCRQPLIERCATTDFIEDASATAAAAGMKFYFLGSEAGRAAAAAQALRQRYPGLQIAGTHDGYFRREDETVICEEILRQRTDVLWVGLGSPLQEQFAVRNQQRLAGVTWIRTCGGLFDHLTGRTRRAPRWIQTAGLEWAMRALQEPRRLGPRYLKTNPVALYYLLTRTHDQHG